MADDVHDVWRREFEDLGEEQVHARLGDIFGATTKKG